MQPKAKTLIEIHFLGHSNKQVVTNKQLASRHIFLYCWKRSSEPLLITLQLHKVEKGKS